MITRPKGSTRQAPPASERCNSGSVAPFLKIAGCKHEAAAHACKTWHYSRTVPAGKLVKVGVWEGGTFIGCVIFGRGANNNLGNKYGLKQTEVCKLVRIALTDHQAPVSKIAALAIRFLRRTSPGLRLIVSYADPVQGHVGGIYQAGNWIYSGRSQDQRELLVNGKDMHKRSAFSKWGTAAPERLREITGQSIEWGPTRWKHTYLMPLDEAMRAQLAPLRLPYPKKADDHGTRPTAEADQAQAGDRESRQAPAEQEGAAAAR